MALRGAKIEELKARCVQFQVGPQTQTSYVDEVLRRIQKAQGK